MTLVIRVTKLAIGLVLALQLSAAAPRPATAQALFESAAPERAQATAPQESPCAGVPFAFSYMITNRNNPWATTRSAIVPAAPGSLSFYTASGAYRSDVPRLRYQATTQQTFLSRLRADLNRQRGSRKSLAVFIHGLGNLFSHALTETAVFGCALAKSQGASPGYPGLVIGFSWPSYGLAESTVFYASNPPSPPSGTIRDNILGSRESFVSLMQLLDSLQDIPVDISLLTHSAGNYMLMVGMTAANPTARVQHCLMMGADISAVSLQEGQQGQAIADICQDVAVYYSGADAQLTVSNYQFVPFHVKDYPTRLGLIGPYYYANPAPLNGNVTGVDSSKVTVDLPGGIAAVHASYRSLPAVLADLTQTMLGLPPTNRCLIPGTTQGFTLEAAAPTNCGP
jgi:esterase/lipase superfamily enzyme